MPQGLALNSRSSTAASLRRCGGIVKAELLWVAVCSLKKHESGILITVLIRQKDAEDV